MRREAPLRLHSALPPQDLLRLIDSRTGRDHLAVWFKVKPFWKPVLGRVDGPRFRLRQHRNFQNSFGPLFYGEVVPIAAGSEIRGRFRMHPLARGFLALWLAGLVAFGVIGAIQGPSPGSDLARWHLPLFTLAMGGGALLIVRFSWWLGNNERRTIRQFLEDLTSPTLGAHPSVALETSED